MKKIIVSLVVLLILSFGNTIDEAQAYYEKGDYASAFNIFENLAYKNDAKAQKTAITKGAGILIVVWSDSIDDEVLELAKLHHCPIIISGHGTMNTSRYLYFSPSVKLLMKRDVVSFNMDEFVEDVGKKMLKTR